MALPKYRPPTHPGEILKYEFMEPLGITQTALAQHLGCTRPAINEIINGKRGITPEMACKLADAFGMSVEFWAGLQSDHDLWHALKKHKHIPKVQAVA